MTTQDFASSPPPSAPPRLPPRRRLASLRAIVALILREMATSYGRSPGGYLWAILEPVAGIALLSLVFSALMRSPALGVNFQMFYATGMLPFIMFTSIQAKVSTALGYSKPLLAYPTVTYLDSLIARFLLDMMTKLLVSYILLVGIALFYETRITPDLPVIIEAYALTALLGLGIGTLNCYIGTRFPVYRQAWGIMMRPMFIISGIFFLYEAIPAPYDDYLWYNPLMHVIGLMRSGFYPTYDAIYVSVPFVLLCSLVPLALGLVLLRRYHTDLLAM
ncbi:sugar ABC transporter permease [Aquicoccus sp. SCR17]|nr:sugar ABC transporter permease [Carideicomes alvinocaridis]